MIAKCLGLAGVVAGSSWGFLKTRRSMLAVQALATVLFAAHYGLLGAWSGTGMCILTLVQLAASISDKRGRAMIALFWSTVPMMVIMTVLTWNGLASACAALGMTMATLGRWQTDTLKLRGFFVLCAMGWAGHNVTIGSPFGLTSDTMCFVSNLWRLRSEIALRASDRKAEKAVREAPVLATAIAAA